MTDADATTRTNPDDWAGRSDDLPDDMPEHEIDDSRTVGGGIMSEGGTAVERGTDTLTGTAQRRDRDEDPAGDEEPFRSPVDPPMPPLESQE
jgi:hypothetical protein